MDIVENDNYFFYPIKRLNIGTEIPSVTHEFTHVFSDVRVAQPLVLCRPYLSVCSFYHCIICAFRFTASDFFFDIFKLFFNIVDSGVKRQINLTIS
jgi:hypothetical protein